MRIILFNEKRLFHFELPLKVIGNYEFDPASTVEDKLINIKADADNNWVLYSTPSSRVFVNDNYVGSTVLNSNSFYSIEKDNRKYLIYTYPDFDNTYKKYVINKGLNLLIGSSEKCNINYKRISGEIRLYHNEKGLVIEKNTSIPIYINNEILSENSLYINNGADIFIYGLRILIYCNILFINNPNGEIFINLLTANLQELKYDSNTKYDTAEIKDQELYKESDYFYKSPRLRRSIEEKQIKLQPPPAAQNVDEIPLIYTLGPMLTTGVTSSATLANVLMRLSSGETTIDKSWVQLVTGGTMLLTTILWPNLNKSFQKRQKKKKEKERLEKYGHYLEIKRNEIKDEYNLQKEILFENLIPLNQCIEIIEKKTPQLWSRRIEQEDFLTVRIGTGSVPLKVKLDYSKEDFSMEEDELKTKINNLLEEFKTINDVPVGYSLLEKNITAIMGSSDLVEKFMEGILIQLISFHSYDDLKIVMLTNKNNASKWDFLKQLQHCFSDNKEIRFFATDDDEIKEVTGFLQEELYYRKANSGNDDGTGKLIKPHYIVITDAYNSVKRTGFFKEIEEGGANYGFSLIILENLLSRLPSKCNNFISLGTTTSTILENAYENQKQIVFRAEINTEFSIKNCVSSLANIPIEFDNDSKNLPNKLGFLEMYNVGNVGQLNILNRWEMNDPTKTLKAPIGVDSNGELMALDIHEKYHGPHGLIAGMTGSGKSEFIITYVLSLAVNYSPLEVSFILIDYKGGGLAGAFENKKTGFKLPHLAGVITNLDKAEMNRTLVSIDSEIRRRQEIFNIARDELNESTIDIYKYQGLYREGKVREPLSHLFVICDEFAELKSQQPDFMDNLISVARIGRSLGVHLILATQKPSGVVNDQIWSNSKFRVCLKVQDKQDSMEMLKRPEAAEIKNVGRYYLQVGYNEYFNLGQSAYCGSKYYPSEEIIKNVDKSIKFINSVGTVIKSIQASDKSKAVPAQGEELSNILKEIIDIAKKNNLTARKLWLDSLSDKIYIDGLRGKYDAQKDYSKIIAILGEYDDPESQRQDILTIKLDGEGNIILYGSDEEDKEMALNSIIYSTLIYSSDNIAYYIIDYGSESLRKFMKFPQIGDIVFAGEDEKLNNLFKMIGDTISARKKILSESGKDLFSYRREGNIIPIMNVIINNYDSFIESQPNLEEELIKISRDGERYGVNIIITANTDVSVRTKVKQNFEKVFTLRQNDESNYFAIIGGGVKGKKPKDLPGRGLYKGTGVYEFQTSIITEPENMEKHLEGELLKMGNMKKATRIPVLPAVVTYDYIKDEIKDLTNVPIGVSKQSLDIIKYNFKEASSSLVLANSLANTAQFMASLVTIINNMRNVNLMIVDAENVLASMKGNLKYYYDGNFDKVLDMLINYSNQLKNSEEKINVESICVFLGIDKFKNKVDVKKLAELTKLVKSIDNFNFIIAEDYKKVKRLEFDDWYRNISNNSSGIWVGLGLSDQTVFRLIRITKQMQANYSNDFGWYFKDSRETLIKLLNFYGKEGENVDEE